MVVHPEEYSGRSVPDKLDELRSQLTDSGHAAMLVNELDEIAWLFSLRGVAEASSEVSLIPLIPP